MLFRSNTLTVNYWVYGEATFGIDYTVIGADYFDGTTGTVTFAAGSNTATVTIDPTADTEVEFFDETVTLNLTSGTGYTVGTPSAVTGTIIDEDTDDVTLAVSPTSVNEDGTTNLVYTFTRTGGDITNTLTVNYWVYGEATFGIDYTVIGADDFDGTTGTEIGRAHV